MAIQILYPEEGMIGNTVTGRMYSAGDYRVDYFQSRKIIEVDMSDLELTNTSSDPYIKDVYDFGNGITIRLKATVFAYTDWSGSGFTTDAVAVETNIFNTNTGTQVHQGGGISGEGPGMCCPYVYVKMYGIKLVWLTFYPNGVLPVSGETSYQSIGFLGLVPSLFNENGIWDGVNSFAILVEGQQYAFTWYDPEDAPNSIFSTKLGNMMTFRTIFTAEEWETYTGLNVVPMEGPIQDQDPSHEGGGGGNFDPSSDPIDFPELPTGGALSSGAIKAFVVTSNTIESMFQKLWDETLFDVSNFQKLLEEPLDSLISLHCLPFKPTVGSPGNIKLGNYDFGGGVTGDVVTSQYKTIDCGQITVNEFWGSALDYTSTRIEIFLPFIGIKRLQPDDVMGNVLAVKYNVDVLTGDLTAQIKCGKSVLYKYQGNCKSMIPVSSRQNEQLLNLIKGAGSVAAGAIAGGAGGALAAGVSTAVNVITSKIDVTRSGDLSGAVGMLDHFLPYLIIHRPKQSLAAGFNTYKGYPSNITSSLASLKGYTEVDYINLQNINGGTDEELREIESLLKEGVLL